MKNTTTAEIRPLTFDEVFIEELKEHAPECQWNIASKSGSLSQASPCTCPSLDKSKLSGLAFSGGGIRSATYNLGVIQSLAQNNLLDKFAYLSTVSGGGYIGSWLSAQIHRHTDGTGTAKAATSQQKIEDFQKSLNSSVEPRTEHAAVSWLRSYSNYLTPKTGLSGDTLAAVGTWLRNTLLNQVALTLFFALLLLSPLVMVLTLDHHGWVAANTSNMWLVISVVLSGFVILLCAKYLPKLRCCSGKLQAVHERLQPTWLIILAVTAAAFSMSVWLYSSTSTTSNWMITEGHSTINQRVILDEVSSLPLFDAGRSPLLTAIESYWSPVYVATLCALIYVTPWMLAILFSLTSAGFARCARCPAANGQCDVEQHAPSRARFALGTLLSAPIAGACGGYLIYLLSHYLAQQPEAMRLWWATGFGTPLLLAIFCLILMLHQGLMARLFRISQMEWWARIGGYVLLVAAAWAAIHALLIYIPPLIDLLEYKFIAAGEFAWAAHSLAGILLGKSASASGKDDADWKEWITRAAPYMFVLGFMVAISWVVHALMYNLGTTATPAHLNLAADIDQPAPHFSTYLAHAIAIDNSANLHALGYVLITGVIAFLVLAWRLDVNLFSIHHFYRNRLTRCYLGAGRGNARVSDTFTGFDPCDDIQMTDLRQRPLHIVNTALNLVHGNDLAWQDRKAYSFTFSPVACGFQYPPNANQPGGGYYDSAHYMNGVRLGTAMAASGAAASPNMGYHSSPAVAFLLTAFNVRLGHWCPNTAAQARSRCAIERDSPILGGLYLLKELSGDTDIKDAFVYLSDGGHFENLGVYELVRRRCRHIMVVDAGQDKDRTYEDLANMIRKCYIDFGARIEIDLDDLHANPDGNSLSCYALGDITYHTPEQQQGEDNNDNKGVLLYIKPSLLKHIPEDIRQYAKTNKDFPHQTTNDQFFDEAQFESYRHLGNFLMDEVLKSISEKETPSGRSWGWVDV